MVIYGKHSFIQNKLPKLVSSQAVPLILKIEECRNRILATAYPSLIEHHMWRIDRAPHHAFVPGSGGYNCETYFSRLLRCMTS